MPYHYTWPAALCLLFTLFACKKEDAISPKSPSITITTKVPDSVTTNSCVSGGKIVTNGSITIVGRGVCWNTSPKPTVALATKTKNRADTGSFSSILFGLTANTTYYARAYVITSLDTLYGQEHSFTTLAKDNNLSLGQYYSGGIIFYLDNTKEHGLVCAPQDVGPAKWGCEFTLTGGTTPQIGAGAKNTKAIIAACSEETFLAKVCDSVELNFYNDWYMPSLEELRLMYENVYLKGRGNFGRIYQSSTEYDHASAWAIQFQGSSGVPYNLYKGATLYARPVRSF
ncbi:MAG: DUF1566 domain-containing protein [Nostoc sp. C3-bin3]|nr:DUF1566 domain-containing protein [Nostoc sp. C3-bin3]